MKVFVDKGFDSNMDKLCILKNGIDVNVSSKRTDDYIELETNIGDRISIELKSFDTTRRHVSSIVCDQDYQICYIGPTMKCKIWEIANYKILPYVSMFSLVLEPAVQSTCYGWFCASMVVATALSLFSYKLCNLIPSVQKNMYKVVSF